LKEPSEVYQIIGRLKSLLAPDCTNGLVSDIQIKTYYRENERYGASRMELVEQLFFADSKYILSVLARKTTTDQFYATTLVIMQRLIALALHGINDQVSFVKNMAGHFSAELAMTPGNFKKLNRNFQDLKGNANLDINSPAVKRSIGLEKVFVKVFSTCNSQGECQKLLADLLHMHINRLFNSDQRSWEGILYHYLLKILLARRSFSAVPAELPDVI
jgi:thiopeptide-type bacteriocin biosynthesis protein